MSKTKAIQSNEEKEELIKKIINIVEEYFDKVSYIKIVNVKDLRTNESFLRIIPEKSSIAIFEIKHDFDINFIELKEKIKLLGSWKIYRFEYKMDLKKCDEIIAFL